MSNTQGFIIPDLKKLCPWQVATNPRFNEAFTESSVWIDRFDFFQDAKRQHFIRSATELLASYAYPYADPEELRICCDAMNLFWVIDEMLDDHKYPSVLKIADIFVKAMEGKVDEDSAIIRMVNSWKERLDRKIKPLAERRFIEAYDIYLTSIIDEKQLIIRRNANLQEYEAHRRKNSGTTPFFALIEYARGIELPDEVFENAMFMKMYWAAVDMVGYSNDLYSYSRERDIGLDENNLLTVLMRERNISLQEAANHVGDIFEGLVNIFETNKALLPSFASLGDKGDGRFANVDEDVQIYTQSMEEWIIGNICWSFATQRYFGTEHKKVEQSLFVKLNEKTQN